MDWNRVEGNWKQMKGKIEEQWGKLTDDDLDVIEGKRDQLEGKIQERYGYAKVRRPVKLMTSRAAKNGRAEREIVMTADERETGTLIGSDKVEGTAVYGNDATRIGSIERVMIEKGSGKAACRLESFGGFLGIGDDHYPLPWASLTYNTNLGGYQVANVSEDRLKNGAFTLADLVSRNADRLRSHGKSKRRIRIKNPDNPAMQRVRDASF